MVVILSIHFRRILDAAPLVAALPAETVIIDTGNYYPFRDTTIKPIEAGQVGSVWVAEQLGRPIASGDSRSLRTWLGGSISKLRAWSKRRPALWVPPSLGLPGL